MRSLGSLDRRDELHVGVKRSRCRSEYLGRCKSEAGGVFGQGDSRAERRVVAVTAVRIWWIRTRGRVRLAQGLRGVYSRSALNI
jgi:hypothetical protein